MGIQRTIYKHREIYNLRDRNSKNSRSMRNTFDRFINTLDISQKKITEFEDMSMDLYETEKQR